MKDGRTDMLKDGIGGKALFNGNVKICDGYKSNWFERLQTAISQKDRDVIVVTYSLPMIDRLVVKEFLTKRTGKTILIYNSKFNDNPQLGILQDFGVKLIPMEDCHAKFALVSPDNVHIGSENFAFSNWFECCVTIKNKTAYEYQLKYLSEYLGFNPLTGDETKGCYSCTYFTKLYDAGKGEHINICNCPRNPETETGLEKGCCSLYRRKERKEYVRYQGALNSPWLFLCKECAYSEQVFNKTGEICGWMCNYFGRFTSKRDEDTHIDCGMWKKR